MNTVSLLPGDAAWRSRTVRYYAGSWTAIQTVLPEFELVPFSAGADEPPNPFLQTVVRKPLSATERPMPVGTVSHSYSLAQHREVAKLCREGLLEGGVAPDGLRYEVGLSELGEWMNLRIYLPEPYGLIDKHKARLDLRLECFNTVDGSSRLVVLFGWYRLVCSNGMVIGESMIEIKERHHRLDLNRLPKHIQAAMDTVHGDRSRMKEWQAQEVAIDDIAAWADDRVTKEWGKKAAARIFHICKSGKDIEIDDPFAAGSATEKPVRYRNRVPGSPESAATKYDVSQAMSFVATHRNNTEERLAWQAQIPRLLDRLVVSS